MRKNVIEPIKTRTVENKELNKFISRSIERLTLAEIEQLLLYFIKRNNKSRSKKLPRALFEDIINDLDQQFGENWLSVSRQNRFRLAQALNELVHIRKVRVTFEVDTPYIPGYQEEAYELVPVLWIVG